MNSLPPGEQGRLILETAGYGRGLCLLTRGAGQVCSPTEKVKLASRVQSGQQMAWRPLRPQSTASLVIGVPGSVLSVSMFLALMMELDLRRFGGGGPRMGLLRFPRMGRGVEPAGPGRVPESRSPDRGSGPQFPGSGGAGRAARQHHG